ncbi:Ankyrin repeat [Dillenia turbinata]|uniref:Ankyrin repeat n=1 Tax=Dillenia turbinata TaxID=194707 RepID=A0AAN8V0F1_9MAGN
MEEDIYQGPSGQTPLHAAVARKNTEMVSLLLRHKKELVKTEDKDGRTPLHYAASFGYLIGVSSLLQYDTACAYIKDKDGFYPLHIAVIKGHINIIQELLKYCPDLRDIQNEDEQNVLHFAASWGRKTVAKSLLNNPDLSDLINERDANGNTPLHLATINRNPKVVSILVCDKRVDMTIMNGEGLTPRDIAEQNIEEHTSFRKLLTQTALRTAGAPRVLIWAQWGDIDLLVEALRISLLLLGLALTMMAMAFASAIYLVVNRLRWLVVVVLLLTAIFLLCIVALFVPLRGPIWSKYRGLRFVSYYAYHILILIVSHNLDDIDD